MWSSMIIIGSLPPLLIGKSIQFPLASLKNNPELEFSGSAWSGQHFTLAICAQISAGSTVHKIMGIRLVMWGGARLDWDLRDAIHMGPFDLLERMLADRHIGSVVFHVTALLFLYYTIWVFALVWICASWVLNDSVIAVCRRRSCIQELLSGCLLCNCHPTNDDDDVAVSCNRHHWLLHDPI